MRTFFNLLIPALIGGILGFAMFRYSENIIHANEVKSVLLQVGVTDVNLKAGEKVVFDPEGLKVLITYDGHKVILRKCVVKTN